MRTFSCLALGGLLLTLTGCVTNPATGEKFFALGSQSSLRQQEISLGVEAAPQMTQEFGGAVNSSRLQSYVRRIGDRLVDQTTSEDPTASSLPWEFTLLDSSVINAFALPGGKVFISRGLAERLTNEAQLAGVLGHEIGHVTAQHIMRRIGQQQLMTVGLATAQVAAGAASDTQYGQVAGAALPALEIGGSLMLLKFGRDEESQADSLGLRYMSRAGYNPRGQLQVMEILKAASGRGGQPEFLATHPLPETRIQRIESLLNNEYRAAASDPKNQFYEERFRSEFLNELKRLPPPRHNGETTTSDGSSLRGAKRAR